MLWFGRGGLNFISIQYVGMSEIDPFYMEKKGSISFIHTVSVYNYIIINDHLLLIIQGGDPIEFKKINDAYNRLIGHVSKLEAIEAEAELSRTSVIIEISKAAVPKWKDKLKAVYGPPKTSKVNNVLFNVSHFKVSFLTRGIHNLCESFLGAIDDMAIDA